MKFTHEFQHQADVFTANRSPIERQVALQRLNYLFDTYYADMDIKQLEAIPVKVGVATPAEVKQYASPPTESNPYLNPENWGMGQ